MQRTPLDKVLSLRPTNVAMRLGQESRLPVLNPRDLLAAIEGEAQALLCIPCYVPSLGAGALKAARDQDAIIGVACPHPLADRDSPGRFVDALRDGAEEVRHRKPLFLQAGPLRLLHDDERAREQLGSAAFRFVDAGFTLLSIDASKLSAHDAARAYREIAQPAIERELSIEVAAPQDEAGRVSGESLRALLEALSESGVLPQFVRVPGAAYALEAEPRETWQLDLSVLKELGEVAREFRAALSIEDEGTRPHALAEAWLEAGVRKVEPAAACASAVLRAWTKEQRDALETEASQAGVGPRELIARVHGANTTSDDAQLRAEAMIWALCTDTLPKLGAAGSSTKAVGFLAQGGRY